MENNEIMDVIDTEETVDTATEGTVEFEPNSLGKVVLGGLAALVAGAVGIAIHKSRKKKKAIKEQQRLLDAREAADEEVEDELEEE